MGNHLTLWNPSHWQNKWCPRCSFANPESLSVPCIWRGHQVKWSVVACPEREIYSDTEKQTVDWGLSKIWQPFEFEMFQSRNMAKLWWLCSLTCCVPNTQRSWKVAQVETKLQAKKLNFMRWVLYEENQTQQQSHEFHKAQQKVTNDRKKYTDGLRTKRQLLKTIVWTSVYLSDAGCDLQNIKFCVNKAVEEHVFVMKPLQCSCWFLLNICQHTHSAIVALAVAHASIYGQQPSCCWSQQGCPSEFVASVRDSNLINYQSACRVFIAAHSRLRHKKVEESWIFHFHASQLPKFLKNLSILCRFDRLWSHLPFSWQPDASSHSRVFFGNFTSFFPPPLKVVQKIWAPFRFPVPTSGEKVCKVPFFRC